MQAAPLAIDTFEERGPTRSFQQLIVSSGMMETAKVLVPFVRKDARSSAAQDVSEQTPFLFVNETTSSPAFKHGGRQDIRSHVRKHVAKRFRQNHKGGKAVREEGSKVTRYPLIAAQAFADSEYTSYPGLWPRPRATVQCPTNKHRTLLDDSCEKFHQA